MAATWGIADFVVVQHFDIARARPFFHMHLVYEAAVGEYDPMADPVFLAWQLGIAVLIFGVGSYGAAIGTTRRVAIMFSAMVPLTALAAHALMLHVDLAIASDSYPRPMLTAIFFSLVISAIGGAAGYVLAVRASGRRRSNDG